MTRVAIRSDAIAKAVGDGDADRASLAPANPVAISPRLSGPVLVAEDNVRLQIIPQLLRMATTAESKALAAKLVNRLIDQV